jgi:CheY-like chemotaxis protein
LLEDHGHVVAQAENGAAALALLKKRECDFDLLITDYAMPLLSGTDFLREARLLCPDVPALLITGYAEVEMIQDRPESVEMLLKPFTPAKLEAAMARSCGAEAVAP